MLFSPLAANKINEERSFLQECCIISLTRRQFSHLVVFQINNGSSFFSTRNVKNYYRTRLFSQHAVYKINKWSASFSKRTVKNLYDATIFSLAAYKIIKGSSFFLKSTGYKIIKGRVYSHKSLCNKSLNDAVFLSSRIV